MRSGFYAVMLTLLLPGNALALAEAPATLPSIDMAEFARKPLFIPGGAAGQPVTFISHSPRDFEPMLAGDLGPAVTLNAQLFLPQDAKPNVPAIILVPGSASVGPHHLEQTSALLRSGIAVMIIDPFSGRSVNNTIADQSQFSWAASVYDVVAATRYLRSRPDIDSARIGALGGSRGGTAVMMATLRPISDKLFGKNKGLKFVVAGYPWCGTQFKSSRLAAETSLLVMSGDKDDWVSVQQCQAAVTALAATGGKAEMRLVKDGLHAFDRKDVPPRRIAEAVTSTNFPIVYMTDTGSYFDLYSGKADTSLTSVDFTLRAAEGGFTHTGVTIGSTGLQAKQYSEAIVEFFSGLKAVRK